MTSAVGLESAGAEVLYREYPLPHTIDPAFLLEVRGLQRMVDEDAYCIDVLTQISSVTRALQGVALELLDEHLDHCVREAITSGGPEADAKVSLR